ncbi:hypothetical protein T484DRAFT_1860447, partial [Baffinella frigidus]
MAGEGMRTREGGAGYPASASCVSASKFVPRVLDPVALRGVISPDPRGVSARVPAGGLKMSENGIGPMGSSVDVGWQDGKPRPMSQEASQFAKGAGSRVSESQISGRKPRPRSKNAPKPALTVNYGEVPRNQMDNIDLEGTTLEDLVMQNAEAIKQFEYLEKSLVSFKETTGEQAADLRQPGATASKKGQMMDLMGEEEKGQLLDLMGEEEKGQMLDLMGEDEGGAEKAVADSKGRRKKKGEAEDM